MNAPHNLCCSEKRASVAPSSGTTHRWVREIQGLLPCRLWCGSRVNWSLLERKGGLGIAFADPKAPLARISISLIIRA